MDEISPREARENLRFIRGLLERSTKHSTFSGMSGIVAGCASLAGCAATQALLIEVPVRDVRAPMLAIWLAVIGTAIGADYLLTKRRAAHVGKHVISALGRQLITSSAPALTAGAGLTLYFLQTGLIAPIFPTWMLCYGTAVCAAGLFSQRDVSILGSVFIAAGLLTLCIPLYGLTMTALSFGGFHILYGICMARKDGW